MRAGMIIGLFSMLAFMSSAAQASALGATGCVFQLSVDHHQRKLPQGPAIQALAKMASASDRGERGAARLHAREAGRLMAPLHPHAIVMLLDVAERMTPGAIPFGIGVDAAREVMNQLDFVARQTAETDTIALDAYLRAGRIVQFTDETDRLAGFLAIEKRILDADICAERKFFLRLALTREIGDLLGRDESRPRLLELWDQSDGLKGVGATHFPVRWTARQQLSSEAARMKLFDLAEPWLKVVEREMQPLLAEKTLDPETRLSIEAMWLHFPEYVEQEADRFRRARSVGLY